MIESPAGDAIRLARWTCTTGSNVQSRAVVVVQAGDHVWDASAEGNGAVDALYEAVDRALEGVLSGHPRLLLYRVTSLGEGPAAEGRVDVELAPPETAGGLRAHGRYRGSCQGPSTIACSVEAYLAAINAMLVEPHWAEAAEAARRSGRPGGAAAAPLTEMDAIEQEPSRWFER
ncbi:MAG: alpha-isopropylmalate synthase regulatory domain-containing protein [Candidatus Limnocylindrales bacterium]